MTSMYADLDRPPLDAAALRRALVTPGSLWSDVQVVDQAPSTNALLAQRAREAAGSAVEGLVVLAEHQTAGRGRLGRVWTAPARSGLAMSVLVRPYDVAPSRWSWIPLLAGLAVAAAVRREAQVEAALKWPNDVMVGERKLAGLLVERIESTSQAPAAVIGVGLNVSLRANELPVPTATSLALEEAATTDRSLLARAILRNLEGLLTDWMRHGGDAEPGGLHAAYLQACMTIGRQVRVELPNADQVEGTAVGIDSAGHLLVRNRDRQHTFTAGDVLHLR
ncbi:MAG: biotin--[acetyl-CoA-carboxylase] ligase [Actinomycetota bacterium]|nr:biotin--[acetyl-CoA-carboxylase] ligase [Nocardioidaceae bacterium]MDQ3480553.1 biotin--[acetyl-CoA-carboxylase] ligase [Actinomycetota bacterium]